jgi:hypothetical protein
MVREAAHLKRLFELDGCFETKGPTCTVYLFAYSAEAFLVRLFRIMPDLTQDSQR